jgi:hypothetical protein
VAAGVYNIQHPNTKGGTPNAGQPHIHFLVTQVTFPHTHNLIASKRPDQDPRVRKRARRERKVTLLGKAIATADGSTGVRTGAGDPSGSGKAVLEALETAWSAWKDSGAARLQLGTKDDGTAKTYDGIIENFTPEWKPEDSDDVDDVKEVRFTLTFLVASSVV